MQIGWVGWSTNVYRSLKVFAVRALDTVGTDWPPTDRPAAEPWTFCHIRFARIGGIIFLQNSLWRIVREENTMVAQ